MTKYKLGIFLAFFIVTKLSVLSSCSSNEDPKPDVELPHVMILGLIDNQVIWNNIEITIEATDNIKVEKLEFFMDNVLVKKFIVPPYSIHLNTKNYSEGIHEIKAIATDEAGHQAQDIITVTIQNNLISLSVPENYLTPLLRGYIFLSNKNGKFITGAEFKNSQAIILKDSTFLDNEFYLTEVSIYKEDNYQSISLNTFEGITRGKWSFPQPNLPIYPEYSDTVFLHFKNPKEGFQYNLTTNGLAGKVNSNRLSDTLLLLKSPSKLLVTAINQNGEQVGYQLFNSIQSGYNPIFDLTEITNPFLSKTVSFPADAKEGGVYLTGIPATDDYSEQYDLGGFAMKEGSATVLVPGNAFPNYYYGGGCFGDDYQYYFRLREISNVQPFTHLVEVGLANKTITYTATGGFDFADLAISADHLSWNFKLRKKTNGSIPVLETPNFISEIMPVALTNSWWTMDLFEYETINDYDGLISNIRANDNDPIDYQALGRDYRVLHLFGDQLN